MLSIFIKTSTGVHFLEFLVTQLVLIVIGVGRVLVTALAVVVDSEFYAGVAASGLGWGLEVEE